MYRFKLSSHRQVFAPNRNAINRHQAANTVAQHQDTLQGLELRPQPVIQAAPDIQHPAQDSLQDQVTNPQQEPVLDTNHHPPLVLDTNPHRDQVLVSHHLVLATNQQWDQVQDIRKAEAHHQVTPHSHSFRSTSHNAPEHLERNTEFEKRAKRFLVNLSYLQPEP